MRHHADSLGVGVVPYLSGDGQAAAAGNVRLHDVAGAVVNVFLKFRKGEKFLAGGDIQSDVLPQTHKIGLALHAEGFLHPEYVVLLKGLAGVPCDLVIRPGHGNVNHQYLVRPERLARGFDQFQILLRILAQSAPAELDAAVALLHVVSDQTAHLLGRFGHQNGDICGNFRAVIAAEQLVAGKSCRLAHDVPEGVVNAAHGVDDRGGAAVVIGIGVHFVPDFFHVEGILSDHQLPQPLTGGVRGGHVDDGLDHIGRGVHLGCAGDSGVRMDEDNHGVLCAVADERDAVRLAHDDHLYVCNFHVGSSFTK